MLRSCCLSPALSAKYIYIYIFFFSPTPNANRLSGCSPTNFSLLIAMRPSLSPIELYGETAFPAAPLTAVSHWRSVIKKPPHVVYSLLSSYNNSLWWLCSSRNWLRKLLTGVCLSSRMSEIQHKYRNVRFCVVVVSFWWINGKWIWRRRRAVCQWCFTRL